MEHRKDQYASLVSLIAAEGLDHWFDERGEDVVLVERVDDNLVLEWVYLPEYDWFRGMAKDQRRTLGIPLENVIPLIRHGNPDWTVLSPGITSRGIAEGWTRLSGTSRHEGESNRHGFASLAEFRDAFRAEAIRLSDKLSEMLRDYL